MTPQRWETVKAVFHEALDRPEAARGEFLADRCTADDDLRREVARLLDNHRRGEEGSGFLQALGAEAILGLGTEDAAPARIGPYAIQGVLGEGGMGIVYRAQREDGTEPVALKILRAESASPALARRLENEAEILSRLDHPGIARLFQAGWAEGPRGRRPYFAMELVQGEPILRHARAVGLSVRDRVTLMALVCDAVGHAHAKGVIHRDLKPANVMVEPTEEGIGRPKVLDFGVARVLGAAARPESLLTLPGQLVGTLAYMSPEQAAGDPGAADTRSDVYALGLLTYQLLTGTPAFDLEGLALTEALRVLREHEPVRPSSIEPSLRGGIETIILRAIDKRPERRYATASELGDDLRRWLAGEPIAADAPSVLRQARATIRRHRALALGLGAVSGALLLGVIGTVWQAARATHQKHLADKARADAERATLDLLRSADWAAETAASSLTNLPGGTWACAALADHGLREAQAVSAQMPTSAAAAYTLGYALQRVGEARLAEGRTGEAIEAFTRSVAVRRASAKADPADTDSARTLGVGLWMLAEGMARVDRRSEALAANTEAAAIHQRVADGNGYSQVDRAVYLGISHRRLGEARLALGEPAAAEAEFRQAIALLQDRRFEDPDHPARYRALALAHRGLGDSLVAQGKGADSMAAYDDSLDEIATQAKHDAPADVWARSAEVGARIGRSRSFQIQDRLEESATEARRASDAAERLSSTDPANAEFADLARRASDRLAEIGKR